MCGVCVRACKRETDGRTDGRTDTGARTHTHARTHARTHTHTHTHTHTPNRNHDNTGYIAFAILLPGYDKVMGIRGIRVAHSFLLRKKGPSTVLVTSVPDGPRRLMSVSSSPFLNLSGVFLLPCPLPALTSALLLALSHREHSPGALLRCEVNAASLRRKMPWHRPPCHHRLHDALL